MLRTQGKLMIEAKSGVVGNTRQIQEFNTAIVAIDASIKRKGGEAKAWGELCANQAQVAKVFAAADKNISAHLKAVAAKLMQ